MGTVQRHLFQQGLPVRIGFPILTWASAGWMPTTRYRPVIGTERLRGLSRIRTTMNSAFLADTDKSLLLMRIKELEEHHAAFRHSLICSFNQLLDLKDINTGVHSTRL